VHVRPAQQAHLAEAVIQAPHGALAAAPPGLLEASSALRIRREEVLSLCPVAPHERLVALPVRLQAALLPFPALRFPQGDVAARELRARDLLHGERVREGERAVALVRHLAPVRDVPALAAAAPTFARGELALAPAFARREVDAHRAASRSMQAW
jgi:hypothetical protein